MYRKTQQLLNIVNKQSRKTDKVWFSSLEFGRGANNSSP